MRDRGRFQNFNFLATLHQKNTAIVIIICTTAHVQSLSSFGCNLVEIFKVAERWVVVDVWVDVSIPKHTSYIHSGTCPPAKKKGFAVVPDWISLPI